MKRTKKVLVTILILIQVFCLCGCGNKKFVHFSVDDATVIFQEIYFMQYDSVFDQQVMAELKELHEEYGITCSLYLYEILGDFDLSKFPDKYRSEFEANADWLKLGFHEMTEDDPELIGLSTEEFVASFERVYSEIERFAGPKSITKTIRLHYWYATDEMTEWMSQNNVKALLCPDSEIRGYDLSEDENEKLNSSSNGVIKKELVYYKTDIRFENTEDCVDTLAERADDNVIVIFTHAWCFMDSVNKMKELFDMVNQQGYIYTFLENKEGL